MSLLDEAKHEFGMGMLGELQATKEKLEKAEGRVRVGVAIVLRWGSEVLMGLRKGSHGAGTWAFPGGHLEKGESVFQCAARELVEETGTEISPELFKKLTYTNDVFESEGKHYITLYVETFYEGRCGIPRVMEPEKCEKLQWFSAPPSPLFLPVQNLLATGYKIWGAR